MAKHTAALKTGLILLALSLIGYILGPTSPKLWLFLPLLALLAHATALRCLSSQSLKDSAMVLLRVSFSLKVYSCLFLVTKCSNDILSFGPVDCAKRGPEVNEDTEKNYAELLTEELKQREAESMEKHKRVDMSLLEAKKITSSYLKEADKCNSGMETCEEAREKAEKALLEQKKLTSTWELRARSKGWKEGATKSTVKSKSSVQVS